MTEQKQQTATTVQKGEPVRPDPDMERTIDPTKKHEHEKEEKEKKTPETGGMPGQEPVKQPPMQR